MQSASLVFVLVVGGDISRKREGVARGSIQARTNAIAYMEKTHYALTIVVAAAAPSAGIDHMTIGFVRVMMLIEVCLLNKDAMLCNQSDRAIAIGGHCSRRRMSVAANYN